EIYGKTLGLIGLGEIGVRIATRAKALGVKIVGYDPFTGPHDFVHAEAGVKKVLLHELLQVSDFISIHVPLTPQTHHLISSKQFSFVKRNITIINSSRGGVIDEKALTLFLEDNTDALAILDVLEVEPPNKENSLFN